MVLGEDNVTLGSVHMSTRVTLEATPFTGSHVNLIGAIVFRGVGVVAPDESARAIAQPHARTILAVCHVFTPRYTCARI